MARRRTRTRVSYPARSAARRRTARKRGKKQPGLDWGKVAMFGAGAFILFMVFRPRTASATVITGSQVRREAKRTGRSLEDVLDDLTRGAKKTPESLVLFGRFSTEDGRCVDNLNMSKPQFVGPADCKTCEPYEFNDLDLDDKLNQLCYPRSINPEAYKGLED
jgi:hypothetical protein